jgi:hypothetical protein
MGASKWETLFIFSGKHLTPLAAFGNIPFLGDRIAKEVRRFNMANLDWGNQREWTER